MAKEKKKITITLILAWFFSISFILVGATSFGESVAGALLILLGGLVIFPPAVRFVSDKWNLELSGWLRFVLFLVLVGVGVSIMPSSQITASGVTAPSVAETPTVSGTQEQATESQSTTVQSLKITKAYGKNTDSDPEVDALEVGIEPYDSSGNVVKTGGTVKATLWEQSYDSNFNPTKGNGLGTWEFEIDARGYQFIYGKVFTLNYGFDVESGSYDTGILEVTLITADGKSFTARESGVFLGQEF